MKYEFTNTGHGWIMPWVGGRDCSVDYGTIRWFNNQERQYEYASTAMLPKNRVIEISNSTFRGLYDYSIIEYLESIGLNVKEECYLIIPESKEQENEIIRTLMDSFPKGYRVKKSIL